MSWTPLAPVAAIRGTPLASALVRVLRDGVPRINLHLSGTLMDEFGAPASADVLAGSGENAGQLRIEFKAKGAFGVGKFLKGGGRIVMPSIEGVPERPCETDACRIVESDPKAKVLILALPLQTWSRVPAPPPKAAPQPIPPRPVQEPATGLFDAVEYLSRKGHKCSRLAAGRYGLDGDTVLKPAILDVVNASRKRVGLAALSLAEIH